MAAGAFRRARNYGWDGPFKIDTALRQVQTESSLVFHIVHLFVCYFSCVTWVLSRLNVHSLTKDLPDCGFEGEILSRESIDISQSVVRIAPMQKKRDTILMPSSGTEVEC